MQTQNTQTKMKNWMEENVTKKDMAILIQRIITVVENDRIFKHDPKQTTEAIHQMLVNRGIAGGFMYPID